MVQGLLLTGRFCLALVFIVSGFEKLLGPSENFLYVLQAYNVFPSFLEHLASVVFPWIELVLGVFLMLGLWLRFSLLGIAVVSGALILIVLQAIIRQLPIDNCGCFGDLIHLPLRGVILIDIVDLAIALLCLKGWPAAKRFSLDNFYDTARP
jgi:hypothetical protein